MPEQLICIPESEMERLRRKATGGGRWISCPSWGWWASGFASGVVVAVVMGWA